ncbi:hypothetical protein GcM3_007037 [Golovinomyces cichoracearum]|uniref:Uncharacterized protein n=1 Tax=Golovinomyces cichoracearum TaxID=62708 RepID=A0A420JAK7_9PEZI|nr:hypothetical protein GcM3_007037 [Golovinomyces cichoracearum]
MSYQIDSQDLSRQLYIVRSLAGTNEKSEIPYNIQDEKSSDRWEARSSKSFTFSSEVSNQPIITARSDQKTLYQGENRIEPRKVLGCGLKRWLLTFSLCIAYIIVARHWATKSAVSLFDKRVFNSITTGISIALGLNISSAFKDIAQTLRWPLLNSGYQNLKEVESLLQFESLSTNTRLALFSRRPILVLGCSAWVLFNIVCSIFKILHRWIIDFLQLIQVGLAMLSLTYNFDTDQTTVQLKPGISAIPRMNHFYPQTNRADSQISLQDEQYISNSYGQFALLFGIGLVTSEPKPGQIYLSTSPLLWIDKKNSVIEFIFLDSPKDSLVIESFSSFSSRKVNVSYDCKSFRVLQGGDGISSSIDVDVIGRVNLSQPVPDSTTYIVRPQHVCPGNNRCSVIEVFESSLTDPWFYVCDVTVGLTMNDVNGISYISDRMAQIATGSIAHIGFANSDGTSSQTYPRESLWGQIAKGNPSDVGMTIGIFAAASIAGAAQYNPFTSHAGIAPSSGFVLMLNHEYAFYLILFLVISCHLAFVILAYSFARKFSIGPSGNISMSLLLKPITDILIKTMQEKGEPYEEAQSNLYARYEKDLTTKDNWIFNVQNT